MTRYRATWIFILSVLMCFAIHSAYADEADDMMDKALSDQLSPDPTLDAKKEEKKAAPVASQVSAPEASAVAATAMTTSPESDATTVQSSSPVSSDVVSSADTNVSESKSSAPVEPAAVAPVAAPVEPVPAPQVENQTPAPEETPVAEEPVRARDVLTGEEKKSGGNEVSGESSDSAPADDDSAATAKQDVINDAAQKGQLLVADFDSGDKPNNLGGDFGAWDKDPNEDTQGCKMSFAADDYSGNPEGFALRLDYDVDSPAPAYNGLYMKLENTNALPYDTLSFYVRGIAPRYTKRLKVELKTPDFRSSDFFVSGITDQWQKIEIPLKRFKGIKNWATLGELIFVFDDTNTYRKKGTMLIDQIMFERKENGMPQPKSDKKPEEDWEGSKKPA